MTEVAYTSRVRIERLGGPQRLAYLPRRGGGGGLRCPFRGRRAPRRRPGDFPPRATTLDYVVAAAGGDWPAPLPARWKRVTGARACDRLLARASAASACGILGRRCRRRTSSGLVAAMRCSTRYSATRQTS